MVRVALELQPCYGKKSGIGYYTYEIARRLKNNNEFEFYGNIFNFLGRNNNELSEIEYEIYINKLFPYGVYRRVWDSISFEYNKLFNNNADISHFFNYIVPPKVKGKVINTIHDLGYIHYPEYLDKKNLTRIKRDIDYSVERSNIIITVSESMKKEIIENLKIESNKIKVIYNGSTLIDDYLDKKYIKEKWNISGKYFLYVGNIEPRKNLLNLIKAFNYLKRHENIKEKLVIAGQAMWNSKDVFEEIIKLNLEDEVIFTGYIDELEKSTLYKYCVAFVFPSIYEGFGIPLLDALKIGKPIVCSELNVFREVTGNCADFMNSFDFIDIADKMFKVLKYENAERLKRGMEIARNFTWENSTSELLKIYKGV